jgi:hypothetical protein
MAVKQSEIRCNTIKQSAKVGERFQLAPKPTPRLD